jgi:glycosyltransferase involved in cell wall biosynthesis
MRIVLASELFHPSVGGVQEVVRQIGERLATNGHHVRVCTRRLTERRVTRIFGLDVVEFSVSGNLVSGIKGEIDRYREFILRQDYDILVIKAAQQWTFDALIPVLDDIRKRKIFIPCGFSRLFDPEYTDYFRSMPTWLKKFDRLIFYASHYRDIHMARKNGLTNICVLPNGADEREFNVPRDPSFRARNGIPSNAFVVMTVGSLTGLKGHAELAQAFEMCHLKRESYLLLVGNLPHVPPWLERMKEMYRVGGTARVAKSVVRIFLDHVGLSKLLAMIGYPGSATRPERAKVMHLLQRINKRKGAKALLTDLPRDQVIQAYLNSDLFVLASKIEYSPLVLFEAAAAGLPFVSSPVGNAREIAQWTGGGIVCDAVTDRHGYAHVNPLELARRIETLAADAAGRSRLGSNGRKSWQQRFTWATIYQSYERIFEDCLASSTR